MRRWIACALAVAGCGGSPAAPPPRDPPAAGQTRDDELSKLSAQYREEIERRGWSVADDRLGRIGAAVRAVCDRPFMPVSFRLLNRDTPSAFALPTEYVFFSSGLMKALKSDAHVAFFVGHELAHMCLRHHANYVKAGELAGRLERNEPRAREELWEYRRRDELEADEFGLLYAVRAGHAPDEVLGALPAVADHFRDLKLEGSPASQTHPPFAERIAAVTEFRARLVEAHGVFDLASRAYRGLHYERAIELYGRFLSTFPNSAAAHANVATARLLQAAARFEPLTDDLADELMFVEKCDVPLRDSVRGLLERAREDYRRCLAINPRFAAATLNLAAVEIRLGNTDGAARLLESAGPDATGDAFASSVLRLHEGNLAYLAGRAEAALACYDGALKVRPSMAAASFNRGLALAKLGRTDDAVAAWQELARQPEYHDRAARRLRATKPGAAVPDAVIPAAEEELAGVSVGLRGTEPEQLRERLGPPERTVPGTDEETWEYPRLGLEVVVRRAPRGGPALRAKRVRVLDPARYKTAGGAGVSLGDTTDVVERVYGRPLGEVDPHQGQWKYANGLIFSVRDGRVYEMLLTAPVSHRP